MATTRTPRTPRTRTPQGTPAHVAATVPAPRAQPEPQAAPEAQEAAPLYPQTHTVTPSDVEALVRASAPAPAAPAPAVEEPAATDPQPEAPTADAQLLEQIANDLPRLQAFLDELEAQRESVEAGQRARASSPLAIRLELVGCRWASEVYPKGPNASDIPVYVWGETRCHFGKTTPDQDCRDCVHHKITPLGSNEAPHTRRYPGYGQVIPLDAAQAGDLARLLRAMNLTGLRRVDAEIAATRQAIANAEAQRLQAHARELERQQRGQL